MRRCAILSGGHEDVPSWSGPRGVEEHRRGHLFINTLIGERLKDLRVKRAMSQRKLAEAAGMSQRAIVDLETNKREPYPSTLGKLAEALDVDPRVLLGD